MLYYTGQYLGDVWVMDFSTLNYTKAEIMGQIDPFRQEGYVPKADAQKLLCRSNHTSVFYKPHNS